MSFDASTINIVYRLTDGDSEGFRTLYREPNYDKILQVVIDGSALWTRNANKEAIFFPEDKAHRSS